MEASQIFEGAEECESSESGWTTYIGSPINDDDDDDNDDDDDGGNEKRENEADPEDDKSSSDDDSMASDASSGPSNYGFSHSFADFQRPAQEKYDENKYCCLDKKASKTGDEKQMEGKRVKRKEKLFFDSKGKSPALSGAKVTKNHSAVGKRK